MVLFVTLINLEMRIKSKLLVSSLFVFGLLLTGCRDGGRNSRQQSTSKQEISTVSAGPLQEVNTTFNFYIENSGSVKGYFKNKDNDAGKILKEFYDRIDDDLDSKDSIKLHFINNSIEPECVDVRSWLNKAWSRCDAQYSDIDKVLSLVLDKATQGSVNLVLSDFAFVSKDGNLSNARSEITSVFAKALKKAPNTAVAILKYSASFDGNYYPGRVAYTGKLPLYLWIFGPTEQVKEVLNKKVHQTPENVLLFQKPLEAKALVVTNNARMTDPNHSCINVNEWKKDRISNKYIADLSIDLSKVLIPESDICKVSNYHVGPAGYVVSKIEKDDMGKHHFYISTTQCSPSTLKIAYQTELPSWVESSNYEVVGKPMVDKTYGIKYLIEGVHDAFYKKGNMDLFTVKTELK